MCFAVKRRAIYQVVPEEGGPRGPQQHADRLSGEINAPQIGHFVMQQIAAPLQTCCPRLHQKWPPVESGPFVSQDKTGYAQCIFAYTSGASPSWPVSCTTPCPESMSVCRPELLKQDMFGCAIPLTYLVALSMLFHPRVATYVIPASLTSA